MSIGTDQGEVLIPTVVGGKVVSEEDAIRHYEATGENLGVFQTPEDASAYAQSLHEQQADQYVDKYGPFDDLIPAQTQRSRRPEDRSFEQRTTTQKYITEERKSTRLNSRH